MPFYRASTITVSSRAASHRLHSIPRRQNALKRFSRKGIAAMMVVDYRQAAIRVRVDPPACSRSTAERESVTFECANELADR